EIVDANYRNRGELLLRHRHDGVDLRLDWAREALAAMARLWRRPVRLDTVRDGRPVRLGHDGTTAGEEPLESSGGARSAAG
ncbi:MAG: hypothetical protein D6718_06410, partial [Acidobacteria bacterium]